MGYPTQFSMSGKLTKGDIKYHTSILYDEINVDGSKIEFKYQEDYILSIYKFLCMETLRPEN